MKLSATMERHLVTLAKDGVRSAYPGLSLGTLHSLDKRNLVKARHETGSLFFPHTHIKWALTKAGKEMAAEIEAKWNGK